MSDKGKRRATSPEETEALFTRIHQEALVPNAKAIARIHSDGDVAVVFWNVGVEGDPQLDSESKEGAHAMGWSGGAIEVTRMNKTRAARLAEALTRLVPPDPAAGWFRSRAPNRIYLCAQGGTFCLNVLADGRIELAPGTTDLEWMS